MSASSLSWHSRLSRGSTPPREPLTRRMAALMRGKDSSRCLLLLAAVLMVESSQLGSSRAKLNSIKSSLGGETPAQAANRSAGMNQGLAFGGSKKGKSLGQVGNPHKHTVLLGEVGTRAFALAVWFCTLKESKPYRSQVWRFWLLGRGFMKLGVCMDPGTWAICWSLGCLFRAGTG